MEAQISNGGRASSRGRADITSRKLRAAITNGSHLLADLDHRLAWARRLKDLIAGSVSDLGGIDAVSEHEKVLIRRAAMLTLQLELLEQRFAKNENGEATNKQIETYQRTTNTLRRVLESLGLQRRPRDINGESDEAKLTRLLELAAEPDEASDDAA
jgi:hypothetical protein